jgi:hypothetical protein
MLELFRFEILTECKLLARDGDLDGARRKVLSRNAEQEVKTTAAKVNTIEATYIRNRPAMYMDDLKAERAWFAQNCHERVDKFVEEYKKLAVHVITENRYMPLSLQEN